MPYVYSLKMPLTLGELTILMNLAFIALQILILRKNYSLLQLIQLPSVIVFGYFIDLCMVITADMAVSSYFWQVLLCVLSCAVIAFGVFIMVEAKFSYLPGDGLAIAIAFALNQEFSKIKIGLDSAMVIGGIVSSFLLINGLEGVREGTVVAALLVGFMVKIYSRGWSTRKRVKTPETEPAPQEP